MDSRGRAVLFAGLVGLSVLICSVNPARGEPAESASELALADAFEKAGNLKAAAEHFRIALGTHALRPALEPGRQTALDGAIRTLARQEHRSELVTLLLSEIATRRDQALIDDFDFVLYHRWLGESYNSLGHAEQADESFSQAVDLARKFYHGDEVQVAAFQIEVASNHLTSNRPSAAEATYRELIAALDGPGKTRDLARAHALNGYVGLLALTHREDAAIEALQLAIKLARRHLPPDSGTVRMYEGNLRGRLYKQRDHGNPPVDGPTRH